jgi:hypothetical protein
LGGWNALESASTEKLAADNFATLRKSLSPSAGVVAAGGWYNLQQHAADPKGALLQYVASTSSSSSQQYNLDALVALLQATNKGFDSETVDGEWTLLLQRQGRNSATAQKLVGKAGGKQVADFDVSQMKFHGVATVLKWGKLFSTVSYRPVRDNFSVTANDKRIVIRRIACDIVGAAWKFWRFPTISLPLRRTGGFLDFVYLDRDIRVTVGNRGGLFVHARPQIAQSIL